MTAGKNRFIFYLLLLFATERFYASSKNITSLSLNFTRTESTSSQPENKMTGSIIYNKNPFFFVFQTNEPSAQTLYQNSQGAWLLQDDTVIDISDQQENLTQICNDFLNWFKDDYGLKASGFAPSLLWLENDTTVSRWDKEPEQAQPIDHVIVYSDSLGRLTGLNMYVIPLVQAQESESEEIPPQPDPVLFTSTTLSDFKYSAGHYYPAQITSVSYENNIPLITTKLSFSNISFAFSGTDKNTKKYAVSQILELKPSADLSRPVPFVTVQKPEETVYRVSIPAVLVNTGFKFYKKFITNQDMTNCPFYPSCSQYMLQAVSQNGIAGFFQGLDRLNRCTTSEHKRDLYPVTENGRHYDPVPSKNKGSSR